MYYTCVYNYVSIMSIYVLYLCVQLRKYNEYICIIPVCTTKFNEYICSITSPVTCALLLSNELE